LDGGVRVLNWLRFSAGLFAGVGALILLLQGKTEPAIAILSAMLGFYIGEANGKRSLTSDTEKKN